MQTGKAVIMHRGERLEGSDLPSKTWHARPVMH